MTTPRYAERAAKLLRRESEHHAQHEGAPADAMGARRGIETVERALREARARDRRRRVVMSGVAAAAAAAAVALGAFYTQRNVATARAPSGPAETRATGGVVATTVTGPVRLVLAAESRTASPGAVIEPGGRLEVAQGAGAILTLRTGSRVAIEEASDVGVGESSEKHVFLLKAGTLRADVVPLRVGEQFIVRTGDTEIEVRGTSFAVSVVPSATACNVAASTRVDVREGVVVVRHRGQEHQVTAGATWPSCPPAPAPETRAAAEVIAEPPTRVPPRAGSHAARAGGSSSGAPTSATNDRGLAEQNMAFSKAVELRRAGRTIEAGAAFERFIATYPKSPLRESATVEALRAYRGRDDARARVWAERYLADHPRGAARSEAEGVLGGAR